MFLLCSAATSEKKELNGNQTRRGSLALCQVVTYCKYVTSSRRINSLITRKRTMNSLKQWCNGRANGATIGKRHTLNNTKWLRERKKILRGRKPKIREYMCVLHSCYTYASNVGRLHMAQRAPGQGNQPANYKTSVDSCRRRKSPHVSPTTSHHYALKRSYSRGWWKSR